MYRVSIGLMPRLAIVLFAIWMTVACAVGQTVPNDSISVCQGLRDVKKLNGRLVAIRRLFRFTRRHGGWILDATARGEPCPNMPNRARIWQSAIWLESVEEAKLNDAPVGFTEDSPKYADAIREAERVAAEGAAITVTFIGELRTPRDLKDRSSPVQTRDTMGNGYGVGGAFPSHKLWAKLTGRVVECSVYRSEYSGTAARTCITVITPTADGTPPITAW